MEYLMIRLVLTSYQGYTNYTNKNVYERNYYPFIIVGVISLERRNWGRPRVKIKTGSIIEDSFLREEKRTRSGYSPKISLIPTYLMV